MNAMNEVYAVLHSGPKTEFVVPDRALAALLVGAGGEFVGVRPSPHDPEFFNLVVQANGNAEALTAVYDAWAKGAPFTLAVDVQRYRAAHVVILRKIHSMKRYTVR